MMEESANSLRKTTGGGESRTPWALLAAVRRTSLAMAGGVS